MKILLVSQYFWPETFIVNDLAMSLIARGHTVTVLTGYPSYPNREHFVQETWRDSATNFSADIDIKRVPHFSRGQGRGWQLMLNYLSFMLSASVLGLFFCRERYDAIFCFQPSPVTSAIPAVLLGKLKRIPVVWWVQDLWPETLVATGAVRHPGVLKFIGAVVRQLYRACHLILVPAEPAMASIAKQGTDVKKIHYFPNWADDFYRPLSAGPDLKQQLNLPDGFVVLFAGNVGASQSFETLLAAAQQLRSIPDLHWVVVGDGRRYAWLVAEVERLGLGEQVHLLGRQAPSQMPSYFAAADALLLSLRKNPIFSVTVPSKLQAYLACGRPIVASIDGAAADVIAASNSGFVGEAEDAKALAQNVKKLYQLPSDQRLQMAANAAAYSSAHFDRQQLVAQLEQWLLAVTHPSESLIS